jgi:molybdate transport system permease protein
MSRRSGASWRLPFGGTAAAIAVLFLALPVGALLVRAATAGDVWSAMTDPVVLAALALSLVTTTLSLVLVVVFGTPLALLLARRRFRGSALVETLVDLPIILPPSVAGLALLLAFGRRGLLGPAFEAAGIVIPFTTVAVVVAQVFVSAPFYIRAARAGFRSIDREVEDAARVDGASRSALFLRVSAPLAAPALAAGAVLAWARALGEFGATIMFAGSLEGRTQTLPLLVYAEFQVDLDRSLAAAAVLVVAALAVLVAVRLTRWIRAVDLRLVG